MVSFNVIRMHGCLQIKVGNWEKVKNGESFKWRYKLTQTNLKHNSLVVPATLATELLGAQIVAHATAGTPQDIIVLWADQAHQYQYTFFNQKHSVDKLMGNLKTGLRETPLREGDRLLFSANGEGNLKVKLDTSMPSATDMAFPSSKDAQAADTAEHATNFHNVLWEDGENPKRGVKAHAYIRVHMRYYPLTREPVIEANGKPKLNKNGTQMFEACCPTIENDWQTVMKDKAINISSFDTVAQAGVAADLYCHWHAAGLKMCGKKPLNYNLNYTGYNLDDERMKTLMASPNFQTFRKKVQDLKEFIKEILPDLQRAARNPKRPRREASETP